MFSFRHRMAKAEGEMFPCGGAGEKFRKRPFRPEIYEEPKNVSDEAGRNVSCLSTHQCGSCAGTCATSRKSELEEMLKQMTFTSSETQHLIALLHSRTIEESATPLLRPEASTSGSRKKHKYGDERDSFHAAVLGSRVLEEEIASPADLANAYNGSTISRQDSKLIKNNATSTCLSITSVASPQHPTTMENLPSELLSNIFIRLLAKQLAQMRSVSKSWNALLSESSFVKSHLRHSIHNNDQILLVFHDEEIFSSDNKPFTVMPTRSPCLELINFIKLPVNPQPECINGIQIIGSVNGLICSRYGDSIIHIWNPSLSALLALPPYSTPSSADIPVKIHFQFGYDPKTDDYKVVKLTGLTGQYINFVEWWLQVEIYSMRKGFWELINGRFPSHIARITNGDYVCVGGHNGHFHWLCETKDFETVIAAFDLGTETFHEIPLPHSILDHDRYNEVGDFPEKLNVLSYIREDDAYEVWVMDEYGVAESWVKRYFFPQFTCGACPFGFTSDNEFLIEHDGSLVMYDPVTNKQKTFDGYCVEEQCVDKMMEYVDSLAWVAPTKHEKVDGGGQI